MIHFLCAHSINNINTEYKSIIIKAIPEYLNIKMYDCFIIFMLSKTDVRFFYYHTYYDEVPWDKFVINNNITWKTVNNKLKDKEKIKIYETVENILSDFYQFINASIVTQFKIGYIDSNI